ncbi:MAG: hypothetical protein M0P70_02330 [Desulfobulbaceae bacterium]|nr:hypothetical protein [Desulfobulbaceae bacterium]
MSKVATEGRPGPAMTRQARLSLTQLSDLIYFVEITVFFCDIVAALISVMGIQQTGDRIQND